MSGHISDVPTRAGRPGPIPADAVSSGTLCDTDINQVWLVDRSHSFALEPPPCFWLGLLCDSEAQTREAGGWKGTVPRVKARLQRRHPAIYPSVIQGNRINPLIYHHPSSTPLTTEMPVEDHLFHSPSPTQNPDPSHTCRVLVNRPVTSHPKNSSTGTNPLPKPLAEPHAGGPIRNRLNDQDSNPSPFRHPSHSGVTNMGDEGVPKRASKPLLGSIRHALWMCR